MAEGYGMRAFRIFYYLLALTLEVVVTRKWRR